MYLVDIYDLGLFTRRYVSGVYAHGVSVEGYMSVEFYSSNPFPYFLYYYQYRHSCVGLIHCSKATIQIRKLSHCCITVSHEPV